MGFTGAILLAPFVVRSADGAKRILEVMSPDAGDCTLSLTWPWGSMAVNRVFFDDHQGAFKAVVESTARGVRVTFDGWGNEPFVASAEKRVRVTYRAGREKQIDFTAEASPGAEARVRQEGGQPIKGRRIVIGLGEGAPQISGERAAK